MYNKSIFILGIFFLRAHNKTKTIVIMLNKFVFFILIRNILLPSYDNRCTI